MAFYPVRTAISDTYPNPSNATARTGFGTLWDYVTSIPLGQCRLVKSGANALLQRYNGQYITINGAIQLIPTAGVTLAPTGLTVGTLYYIYAWMNGATMTLEASTTGHSTDSTTGVEIKTADATRSLVGMVRPITGPAFVDSSAQRFVVSWFNRRNLCLQAVLAADSGNSGTTYAAISATLSLEYLSWAGDTPEGRFQGMLLNNVANALSFTSIFLDGSANESFTGTGAYAVNAAQPVFCSLTPLNPAEGYHIQQVYARQGSAGNTATYSGGGTSALRCVHSGVVQG